MCGPERPDARFPIHEYEKRRRIGYLDFRISVAVVRVAMEDGEVCCACANSAEVYVVRVKFHADYGTVLPNATPAPESPIGWITLQIWAVLIEHQSTDTEV
jgi:hypothetical protein